jgi:hypothetical protein
MWGAPGTLLAAMAMTQWTGEPHWQKARARRPLRYVPAAVTTVSGGRTTTFAWPGVRECHGGLN